MSTYSLLAIFFALQRRCPLKLVCLINGLYYLASNMPRMAAKISFGNIFHSLNLIKKYSKKVS